MLSLQEIFKRKIEHYVKRSRRQKVHVAQGYYSRDKMKTELKWSKQEPQRNRLLYISINYMIPFMHVVL